MTMHGLLRADTSSLQTMQIKARYADAAGASHHHGLYRFDVNAFDSHSKPVGFSFAERSDIDAGAAARRSQRC